MNTTWFVYVTIFLVAIIQIPIAIDLLRFVVPQWKISRVASQFVHMILFVSMGMIICIAVSYHLFVYLPLIAPDPLHTVKGWLHLTFALWLWINMMGNYYYVVSVHPGDDRSHQPQKTQNLKNGSTDSSHSNSDSLSEQNKMSNTARDVRNRSEADSREASSAKASDDSKLKENKITNGLEWHPKDTHYCKICESVIPHIDHHCPFTGCCAGLNNYSYFFVGLCYGAVGLFYAVAITLPYFFDCNLKNILWFFGFIQNRVPSLQCAELGPHSHIFLPVFAGFIVITNVLCLQIIFLLADLSTYNVLTYWSEYPMLRFMWHRIRAGKFLEQNSRLKMLILDQRPSFLWFLVPVSNCSQKHATMH